MTAFLRQMGDRIDMANFRELIVDGKVRKRYREQLVRDEEKARVNSKRIKEITKERRKLASDLKKMVPDSVDATRIQSKINALDAEKANLSKSSQVEILEYRKATGRRTKKVCMRSSASRGTTHPTGLATIAAGSSSGGARGSSGPWAPPRRGAR